MGNLVELIGNAETMQEAFNKFKGSNVFIDCQLGDLYNPLCARKEFVILETCGTRKEQLLHPYGSNVAYKLG